MSRQTIYLNQIVEIERPENPSTGYLYFDEKDELNFKQSSLLNDISKPFTVNSFK